MIFILGSASPRRKELLSRIIPDFTIKTADIDESEIPGETPLAHCRRLAEKKSDAIIGRLAPLNEDCLLITSDTIVTADDRILGKPAGRDGAFEMLTFLKGRSHRVITAITLSLKTNRGSWKKETGHDITSVTFRDLTPEEINHYLDLIHYSDKAGAYAIQEHGELIIDSIKGSRSNVIGFPEALFKKMLGDLKIDL